MGLDSKETFINFYKQISLVKQYSKGKDILEVGSGSSIIKTYLKNLGYNIKVLDLDLNLNPEYVGCVTNKKFKNKFSLVLCCEVLEHLPLNKFEEAIKNLLDMSDNYIILSLPYPSDFYFNFSFSIPLLKKKEFRFSIPKFYKSVNKNGFVHECKINPVGNHFWEMGLNNLPRSLFLVLIEQHAQIVYSDFEVGNNHCYYIVIKKKEKK